MGPSRQPDGNARPPSHVLYPKQLRTEQEFGVFGVPNVMTASALTLLALVGAIVGVDLGRSTVAMINPAYYGSPPPGHYYAELTPAGDRPDQSESDPTLPGTALAGSGVPTCLDCAAPVVDGDHDRSAGTSDATWRPAKPTPIVIRGIPQGDLKRYMDYPVTQAEARRQAEQKAPRYVSREAEESSENEAAPEPDGL